MSLPHPPAAAGTRTPMRLRYRRTRTHLTIVATGALAAVVTALLVLGLAVIA